MTQVMVTAWPCLAGQHAMSEWRLHASTGGGCLQGPRLWGCFVAQMCVCETFLVLCLSPVCSAAEPSGPATPQHTAATPATSEGTSSSSEQEGGPQEPDGAGALGREGRSAFQGFTVVLPLPAWIVRGVCLMVSSCYGPACVEGCRMFDLCLSISCCPAVPVPLISPHLYM